MHDLTNIHFGIGATIHFVPCLMCLQADNNVEYSISCQWQMRNCSSIVSWCLQAQLVFQM